MKTNDTLSLKEIKAKIIEAFVSPAPDAANPEDPSLTLLRKCYLTAEAYKEIPLRSSAAIVADSVINDSISRLIELKLLAQSTSVDADLKELSFACDKHGPESNEHGPSDLLLQIMISQSSATRPESYQNTIAKYFDCSPEDIRPLNDAETQMLMDNADAPLNKFVDEQLAALGLMGEKSGKFVDAAKQRGGASSNRGS